MEDVKHPYGKRKTDEEIITDEVYEQAKRIWGRPYDKRERPWLDLPYTHCTSCPPDAMKRPCVCNVVEGTALCPEHWIEDQVRKRMELLNHKQVITRVKLDLDDFSRI